MAELLAPEDLDTFDGVPTTDTLSRGTRLGRYELLLPIAMGGMAKVWAARQHGQRGFTKLVALKTILPNLSQDPAFERMFLDEASIASKVHHPNVCEIYELGEEGKVLYLSMEWVNGDSLVRVLRANGATLALDPRIAARIVADACAGLHAAHELTDEMSGALGVVHRDVSPHNILLSADGHVKVTDFGVAKAMGQLQDATAAGTRKGKLNYMAPEQATASNVDRRSDIFALGCVLYEATTGRLPFRDKGENEHQVMHRVMEGLCVAPSNLVPDFSDELEGVILRALAPQPIQRFATAERMRIALEEWLIKSGPIVTASHVAAAVHARLGPSIDRRRERIRLAMSSAGIPDDSGNSPGHQSGSGVVAAGAGARSLPPPNVSDPVVSASSLPAQGEQDVPARQYVLAAAMGVSVALVLGGAGYGVWQATRPPPEPALSGVSAAPTAASPAMDAIPSASNVPASAPRDVPAPETSADESSPAPILLRVPDGATLVVDGMPLPNGVSFVPRPKQGERVSVIVRAAGYDDATIALDETTLSPVDVTMRPLEKKRPRHSDPAIPANPY
jgi:serine/threonine protein kinase